MSENPVEQPTGADWIAAFAERLGVDAPTEAEFETLLNIAGVAAHASERIAAPIACFLIGRAGAELGEAMELARSVAGD